MADVIEFPEPKPGAGLIINQIWAADLFTARSVGELAYCHTSKGWFAFGDGGWRPQEKPVAFHRARKLIEEVSLGAKNGHAILSERFIHSVEIIARADPRLAMTATDWNRDPWLCGSPAWTVDLTSGETHFPEAADYITRALAVSPAERAECPLWLKFLHEATGGDAELILFLQRWLGYCLTGDTREQALLFIYGGGGNGKSVFKNTVAGIMGDYAMAAALDTFVSSQSEKHSTGLAMLHGARLVTVPETEEGRAWDEARIKEVTGGDPITAHFMRRDNFTYQPHFKLMIVGNHQPVLHNVDDAARRRFCLVPFTIKPRVQDLELESRLKAEWPQILRWIIDGCLDWRRNGLPRPGAVVSATETYFADQDIKGQWLAEQCEVDAGNEFRSETSGTLFASWAKFARANGELAGSIKSFSADMERRGFEKRRTMTGRVFYGLNLKPPAKDPRFVD